MNICFQRPYPLEDLQEGWENARVTFRTSDGTKKTRFEILNVKDRDLYLHEPTKLIALKCLALFIAGLPLYFLIYTIQSLMRLPVIALIHRSSDVLYRQMKKIASIPYYFLLLEWAALYGFSNPLEGRAKFAKIEREFHEGKTRNVDWLLQEESFSTLCYNAIMEKEHDLTLFAGFCLQPLGSIDSSDVITVEILQKGV